MGYGLGAFLLALGLILALAVTDSINGVDLTMIGWILSAVGVLVIVLTAATWSRGRVARSEATTVHPDGSQSVTTRRSEI